MKIYIVKRYGTLYFSSLKKVAKHIVDEYLRIIKSHNHPVYFHSKWPNPKSWVNVGFYKIFEATLNVGETNFKEVDKELVNDAIDKCSKEI